jgi:hypothetical protein
MPLPIPKAVAPVPRIVPGLTVKVPFACPVQVSDGDDTVMPGPAIVEASTAAVLLALTVNCDDPFTDISKLRNSKVALQKLK